MYSTELALMKKQAKPKSSKNVPIKVVIKLSLARRVSLPSLISFSVILFT